MSWSNITPEQRGLLRWLAKYESEVNNKEYEVAWRPVDRTPVIANRTVRSRKAPGSLTRLNVEELEKQQFLTCSWSRNSVKFKLTADAYKALEPRVAARPASIDSTSIATSSHAKMVQLSNIMKRVYNKDEFQSLCFEIKKDYDDLRGETLSRKMEELVSYYNRHGRLDELWEKVKQDHPRMF